MGESGDRPIALVTGGGTGIGLAIAKSLTHRYHVVISSRHGTVLEKAAASILAENADARVDTFPADLTHTDQVSALASSLRTSFGRLDVLINNAGWTDLTAIGEASSAKIDQLFSINAVAPVRLVNALWALLKKSGEHDRLHGAGPTIINISSRAAFDPFPGLGIYGAAKASLTGLTAACVNEGAPFGLRSFLIAPGAVETPLLRGLFDTEMLPEKDTIAPERIAELAGRLLEGDGFDNGACVTVAADGERLM